MKEFPLCDGLRVRFSILVVAEPHGHRSVHGRGSGDVVDAARPFLVASKEPSALCGEMFLF
jgi:hypothetical protein